jgi:hypothetical protein
VTTLLSRGLFLELQRLSLAKTSSKPKSLGLECISRNPRNLLQGETIRAERADELTHLGLAGNVFHAAPGIGVIEIVFNILGECHRRLCRDNHRDSWSKASVNLYG